MGWGWWCPGLTCPGKGNSPPLAKLCARERHEVITAAGVFASKERKRARSALGRKAKDPSRPTFSWEQKRVLRLTELQVKQMMAEQLAKESPTKKTAKPTVALGGSFGPPIAKRESKVRHT